MSVLNSGFNDISGSLYGLAVGSITNDPSMDEVIKKSGKYKGFTKREQLWSKLFGIPDNLVTSFTENGIQSNRYFYGNMIDWYMNMYGINFKKEKKQKKNSYKPSSDFGDMNNFGGADDFDDMGDFGGI